MMDEPRMNANERECKTHERLVEIERVRLPVTLTALIKITEHMPKGTTMRQSGDWMVFERKVDNAEASEPEQQAIERLEHRHRCPNLYSDNAEAGRTEVRDSAESFVENENPDGE